MSTIYGNAIIIPSKDGVVKETWVLNETLDTTELEVSVSFKCDNVSYNSIKRYDNKNKIATKYDTTIVASDTNSWVSQAYRKLTFDTSPTGALLTWLQSNATKQPDDTAVQDTKSVTITSNGTVSVTPDAPYDALKKVDVTVNVASGGGGSEPATLTITSQSYTGNKYGTFVFVNSEGHLKTLNYMSSPFTFPVTIKTVLGGTVAFVPDGFPGFPFSRDPIGCETTRYLNTIYILVTNSQASVEIYDSD